MTRIRVGVKGRILANMMGHRHRHRHCARTGNRDQRTEDIHGEEEGRVSEVAHREMVRKEE
jgi:hypothetical protein